MLSIAKEFAKQYFSEMNPGEDELTAAFAMGEFEEDPLHRDQRPTWPTDNSGKQFLDTGFGG
ncbi:MAG: hypothetical protein WCH46_01310 [bacterium]